MRVRQLVKLQFYVFWTLPFWIKTWRFLTGFPLHIRTLLETYSFCRIIIVSSRCLEVYETLKAPCVAMSAVQRTCQATSCNDSPEWCLNLTTLYLYGLRCHGNVFRQTCDVYLWNALTLMIKSPHAIRTVHQIKPDSKAITQLHAGDSFKWGRNLNDLTAIILGSELVICNTFLRHQ